MSEVVFKLSDVLWLLGFISAAYAVFKIIKEIWKPIKELHESTTKNANELILMKHQVKNQENSNEALFKCLVAMLDHMITNNNIENMKKIKKELSEYIIENRNREGE